MKKFYCQYCGAEVAPNSKKCNSCNKEFESVLCPKCLFSGQDSEFRNGCPNCGYLKKEHNKAVKNRKSAKKLSGKLFVLLFLSLVIIILFFLYKLI